MADWVYRRSRLDDSLPTPGAGAINRREQRHRSSNQRSPRTHQSHRRQRLPRRNNRRLRHLPQSTGQHHQYHPAIRLQNGRHRLLPPRRNENLLRRQPHRQNQSLPLLLHQSNHRPIQRQPNLRRPRPHQRRKNHDLHRTIRWARRPNQKQPHPPQRRRNRRRVAR